MCLLQHPVSYQDGKRSGTPREGSISEAKQITYYHPNTPPPPFPRDIICFEVLVVIWGVPPPPEACPNRTFNFAGSVPLMVPEHFSKSRPILYTAVSGFTLIFQC